MEDKLIEILESFGYPAYRQGSLSDSEPYQDASFWTFINTNSPTHSFYDNQEYGTEWSYNIFFYSVDPELPYSMIQAARTALKAQGWIVNGRGTDAYSDDKTHTGRTVNITFMDFDGE